MHTEHVKLAADGRLILPAALRHALGVRPGDTLVIDCDGDSLLVRPFEAVIRETQDYFRQFTTSDVSQVDALIADRRDEAAREPRE